MNEWKYEKRTKIETKNNGNTLNEFLLCIYDDDDDDDFLTNT